MIGSFFFGAILGGAAVWLYGRELREFIDERTRTARSRAADTLQAASQGLQSAKESLEGGLSGGKDRRTG